MIRKKRRQIAAVTGCFCLSMIAVTIFAVGLGAVGAVCGALFAGVFAAISAICGVCAA